MDMDLISSMTFHDNSKSEAFIPAPLNSSKLAKTPPEYQADAISIGDIMMMRKKKMTRPDPLLWSQNMPKETAKKNPAKKKMEKRRFQRRRGG
jgi:hypothetical protein